MNELRAIVDMGGPDVIAITETWTNEDITNDFLKIDGFELIVREDREDTMRGRGGGILVYVKKFVCAWTEQVNGDFCQCVCVKLKGGKHELALYVLYRSPHSSSANDERLCDLVKSLRGKFVMVGDFNYPRIRWATGGSDAKGRAFYETVVERCMTQHVETSTHISGNVLDLILSSDDDLVTNVQMEGRLGMSDHEMIVATIAIEPIRTLECKYARDFRKANYVEMRGHMARVDWADKYGESDVEECWSVFKELIAQITDNFVPLKRKRNNNTPPWMDKEVRNAIKEKKRAWDKWKRTRADDDKNVYKKWEKKVKKMVHNKKNSLERQVARECKDDPKRFYSFVNSTRKSRSSVGPLKRKGELVVDSREQAEVFNAHYSSVFTRSSAPIPEMEPCGTYTISDVEITVDIVKSAIDALKEFSAPGPDGICNKMIIELKNEIALPLSVLFRKSLDEGRILDDWRL